MITIEEKIKSIALIALLSFIVYANTFGNEFAWDDKDFIIERLEIRRLSNVPSFFTTGSMGVYRPVRTVFYAVNYALWGQNPLGYHLNALFIHISITILIYLILISALSNRLSLMTALLFAVHPVHTEAISFITTSFDEIGVLFLFISFYLYVNAKDQRTYTASIVFSGLAFFTYEITLTLPLILVLYDYCFGRLDREKLRRYLPFVGLALFYLFVRFPVLEIGARRPGYWGGSLYLTILAMSKAFIEYIRVSVIPLNLSVYHDISVPDTIFETGVLLSLSLLVIFAAITLKAHKRSKVTVFGVSWFFITLLPVSNIIPFQTLMAERYLYLPSMGFCLLLAVMVDWTYQRLEEDKQIIPMAFLVFVLIFYSATTIDRNSDWRDDLSLWTQTIKTNPSNYAAHLNLGSAYGADGAYEEALIEFERALELAPDNPLVHNGLGIIYHRKGSYELATVEYKRALQLTNNDRWKDPSDDLSTPKIHYNLGLAYTANGAYDLALEELQKALVLGLNSSVVHSGLGDVYYYFGLYDHAIVEYEEAVELALTDSQNMEFRIKLADAHNELGIVYGQLALYDLALAEFKTAIELDPRSASAHSNLGGAYAFIGEYDLARQEFRKAVEIAPYNETYRITLARFEQLVFNNSMRMVP